MFFDIMEKLFAIFAFIGLGIAIYEAILDRYLKDIINQKRKLAKLRRINLLELPEGRTHEGTEKKEGDASAQDEDEKI